MNKALIFFAFTLISLNTFSEVLTLEGQYQNKNVYVSNAVAGSGVGFCAYEIRVNGMITTDEVNSSAFEIDLAVLGIKTGDPVIIQIFHKDGCAPKVLNPTVLKPMPTFETIDIKVSNSGLLEWTTQNESGELPYIVEQYKWNKWIKVGEVQGIGTPEKHTYRYQLILTSGVNKFRVTQRGNLGKVVHSPSVEMVTEIEKVSFKHIKEQDKISFSKDTHYEIYDKYGQARVKGFGKEASLVSLKSDEYYLCFDNSVETIQK
jgi:purine-nucleoside phosphorylase